MYPSALMGDLNFSYWEVYNTKTGEPCEDKIALATKYNAETGQYESVLESANGFDEETIRLVGIKEDLTLVPHYVTATYKLTMKTSAGEVTTAYYPAGTTIGLQDVPGDGYETYRWRVVHYPITETTDNYGNAVLELTSEAKLLDDAYEGKDYVLYIMALFGQGIRAALFVYLFKQFFRGIPVELEESAQIDGAGVIRTFWSVMLPNARGCITTVSLFNTSNVTNMSYMFDNCSNLTNLDLSLFNT
ncbi:MAG: ABC transporter permease subunit, partial [Erysipelotrichaceae bacterium]|nr:ABC transporter permease subunit [Erysipelotrichaceae bacterium]